MVDYIKKKMVTYKKDNRGITMMELVVTIAVFSIIGTTILAFMLTGSKTFQMIKYTSDLQFDSQMAMALMQDYAIDCNGYVKYKDSGGNKPAFTINTVDGATTVTTMFVFDQSDGILYLEEEDGTRSIVMKNVESFKVDFVDKLKTTIIAADGTNITETRAETVNIQLLLRMGIKKYDSMQTFALRNVPLIKD